MKRRLPNEFPSSALMSRIPYIRGLAANPDLPPHEFKVENKTAGYAIPATQLAEYLEHNPAAKETTTIKITGTRESYEDFRDNSDHILTKGDAAAILCLGTHGDQDHLLGIVSPSLFEKFLAIEKIKNTAPMPQQNFGTPDQDPAPPCDKFQKLKVIDFQLTAQIAQECAGNKAVILYEVHSLAAVPVVVAEALKNKFFKDRGDDFIRTVTSKDFNRHRPGIDSVQSGKNFLCVTRGTDGKYSKGIVSIFTVIPAHLLQFLDMEPDGKITGIKDISPLRFSFTAAAEMRAIDDTTETILKSHKNSGNSAEWIKLMGNYNAGKGPKKTKVIEPPPSQTETNGNSKMGYWFSETAQISGNLTPEGMVTDLRVAFQKGSIPEILMTCAHNNTATIHQKTFAL